MDRETSMLRFFSALLTLVLAAGPTAAVLCRALCDEQAAAATGCHHADSGAGTALVGADACDTAASTLASASRGEVRKVVASHALLAAVTPLVTFAPTAAQLRGAALTHRTTRADHRPLTTTLRI
jgi:hypothetical protein